MNLNKIKLTMATGMLAASMILPSMTVCAAKSTSTKDSNGAVATTGTAQIEKYVKVDSNVTSLPTGTKVIYSVKQTTNASSYESKTTVADQTVEIDVSSAKYAASSTDDNTFAQNILTDTVINSLGVGEYTFEIKETTTATTSDFGWTSVDSGKTYYLRVLVDKDNNKKYFLTETNTGTAATDTAAATGMYAVDNKKAHADFENTYNKKSEEDDPQNPGSKKPSTLTVTKNVTNKTYVDKTQKYPVTVTLQLPETQKKNGSYYVTDDTTYTATISGAVDGCADVVTRTVSANVATDGKITFTADLHDGESIVISNMAVGTTYSVEETTAGIKNLASTSYKVDNETAAATCSGKTLGESSRTVTIDNTFKDITVTGVVTNVAPYVTLVVVAIAAVAAYMGLKSRIAR